MFKLVTYFSHRPRKTIAVSIEKPKCVDCKYSSQMKGQGKFTVCTLFIDKYSKLPDLSIGTEICRVSSSLCGPDGQYFKMKN